MSAADLSALKLADFRDRHRGETVVVCGCGESLNLLERPQHFVTIGVNDVGRRFTPDYLVVVNPRSQFCADRFNYVENSKSKALFTQFPDLGIAHPCIVNFRLGNYGGVDFSDPDVLQYTQNSPYVALCLAAYMGASRIGLIGVDFTANHFFAATGTHPLATQLSVIDEQYRRLGEALRARGIEVVNLSPASRLTAFQKITVPEFTAFTSVRNSSKEGSLRIVSYATTPIAGVPLALAHCINARTQHQADCVWATNDYGNGVRFDSGIEWARHAEEAEARLREADLVIVHNGKVESRHRSLLERKAVITMAHNYMWNVDGALVSKGFPGVVVGQYQATLPEFVGWGAVPNPLPFWENAYVLERKPDTVTICFTPSGTHERYPREHRLYWHSKGYETTLRVVDRLSQRFNIRVEALRGTQVSQAESLAIKRRAHIVIDECVTGSYHRNSLEGLACGCVVVNGVGLLPGVADALRRCAPSTTTIPFVQADLESLESVLTNLIEAGPDVLIQRGLENRAWLETHWDFARQWGLHWEPVVRRAKAVAGSERSSFVKVQPDTARSAAQPGIAVRQFGDGVSVVIPHGGVGRLPHLGASLANLAQARGVSEVIVAEMGEEPCADTLTRRWGAKYIFIHNPDAFERARVLNTGAALAEFDLVLWKDNDLLLPESFVQIAAAELRSRNLDHLLPYEAIRYLTAPDSRSVIAGSNAPASCQPARVLYGGRDVSGGAALIRSDFLFRFGGIPDMFRGWGGEDNAWAHKAALFGRTGVTQRKGQYLFHLHHPDSGALAGKPLNNNPYYAENVARLGTLRAISSIQEFARRFPDSGRRICPWDKSRRIVVLHRVSARAFAANLQRGLRELYGIDCVTQPLATHGGATEFPDAQAIIIVDPPEGFAQESSMRGLWHAMIVVVIDPATAAPSEHALLQRAGAVVMFATTIEAVEGAWPLAPAKLTDPMGLAIALVQPLSLMIARHENKMKESAPVSTDNALPIWLYWEGECPEWIRLCQETIRRHASNIRLLDREAFESLWDIDRDINIARLQVAHRSDFVRAFLLARYGGLWIDSDCIVMQSLSAVLDLLRDYDFIAHKDRQGFYPNGFIGARAGSIIAAELYRRICEQLRAGRSLGWISLGGEPLTDVLRTTPIKWHELPCEKIQPICWSHPEAFFEVGLPDEHDLRFDREALCYMLSNTEVQKFRGKHPERDLLGNGTFFRYLLDRALGADANTARSSTLTFHLGLARETSALIDTVARLSPRRILEIGVGTGIRGLLIRESYGLKDSDTLELHGMITDQAVDLAVRKETYDNMVNSASDRVSLGIGEQWDLVILDSCWYQWPKEIAAACLKTALEKSAYVLIFGSCTAPGLNGVALSFIESFISSVPVEDSQDHSALHYLFSLNDPQHIARHKIASIFETIFRDNCQRGDESVSGPGSCLAQTYEIRQRLPFLFADLGVQSMLDLGCGDFHWLQHLNLGLENYIGIDIVKELIARNRHQYGRTNRQFILADISATPLPRSDLILCRDCLVHFSFTDITRILRNLSRSGSTYLLTTTFPERLQNQEIATGEWRPLNLERAPFNFPHPLRLINEKCTENGGIFTDKSLGLWRLADLRL